jgi:APA family basic amino acid/polyamine antiporter
MGISFCLLLSIYKPNFIWGGLIVVLSGLPIYYVTKRIKRETELK